MSINDRMKRIEKAHRPADNQLQAILPEWLQSEGYEAPEITCRVITPRGYLGLQPDGSVKWHE